MAAKHIIPLSRRQILGSLLWGIASVVFGWSLFAWWWSEVLRQDQARPLLLLFVVVILFCALVLVVTFAWIWHNRRIARLGRRGVAARYQVRHYAHDVLGREVVAPSANALKSARVVRIDVQDGRKLYTLDPEGAQ